MTLERIEEIKHYFTDEQLDELSREYRTMPTDGEGYAIEPEYEGMVARGNIVKLVSDVKTARAALEESQQDNECFKAKTSNSSLGYGAKWKEKALDARKERDAIQQQLVEAQQTIAIYKNALEVAMSGNESPEVYQKVQKLIGEAQS